MGETRQKAANKACQKLKDMWKKSEAENRANNMILQNYFRNMSYPETGSAHGLVDFSEIKVRFCSEDGSGQFIGSEDASMTFL